MAASCEAEERNMSEPFAEATPLVPMTEAMIVAPPDRINVSGHLTFLRAQSVGIGFGPANDFIDVEVLAMLDTAPGMTLGLQLRNDRNRPAHQGMFDLLRDAFNHNWTVTLYCFIVEGHTNGMILETTLTK
jgi:hypothetical protein